MGPPVDLDWNGPQTKGWSSVGMDLTQFDRKLGEEAALGSAGVRTPGSETPTP